MLILLTLFATGVNETGGKFIPGVIDTRGKFAADVVYTGGALYPANISLNFRKNMALLISGA
jgi:hypothetical protein